MTTEQASKRPFRGFQRPNYTMVPDELFDELMVDLSGAELKTLLYIIRRTYGFKKDSDNISLSQMLHGITTREGVVHDRGVGLTKKTLLQALRSLEDQNIIVTERRQSVEKGNEPTSYRLNVVARPSEEETTPPLGEKLHQGGGGEIPPSPRGKNSPTQETVQQQTDLSLSKIRKATTSDSQAVSEPEQPQPQDRPRSDPEMIGRILRERQLPRGRQIDRAADPDRDVILDYIADFSREFSDRAPLKSSTTRAYNLYRASDLPLETFLEGMYRARAVTKERSGSIRGSKFAYFISILEDLLGLRDGPALPAE